MYKMHKTQRRTTTRKTTGPHTTETREGGEKEKA